MNPVLRFLGACGTVTGSRFLIENDRERLLVDCGLFQGARAQRRRNWAPFGVEPASLAAAGRAGELAGIRLTGTERLLRRAR